MGYDIRVETAKTIERINVTKGLLIEALKNQPPNLTRQQKRHWGVIYDGKHMTMITYLSQLGGSLPIMRDKTTGQFIDHRAKLAASYMMSGSKGIELYLKECVEILAKHLTDLVQENEKLLALQNGEQGTEEEIGT